MTEEEVKKFFKQNFTPIDNIPEDTAWRDAICMEARASLLIEGHCDSERFPGFMQYDAQQTKEGRTYELAEPFNVNTRHEDICCKWQFKEFLISKNFQEDPYCNEFFNQWTLDDKAAPDRLIRFQGNTTYNRQGYTLELEKLFHKEKYRDVSPIELKEQFMIAKLEFNDRYRSVFQLCRTNHKTPERACHFWEDAPEVFGKIKNHGIFPSRFCSTQKSNVEDCLKKIRDRWKNLEEYSQEHLIQFAIEKMVPCSRVNETIPTHFHYYKEWYCSVFPFKDQYNDIKMQLLKLYDWTKDRKALIPITEWNYPNSSRHKLFCVPLPTGKQPLYNLDLLSKSDDATIILTDSVEIADSNQRNAPDGLVFTSFICSKYEQVDWTPLEGKQIYYLISNHSKRSLEEAVFKAEKLNVFFDTHKLNIQLKFIVLPVNYPQSIYRCFSNVDEFISYYTNNPPEAETDLLMVLDKDGFEELCNKAKKFDSRNTKWWLPEASIEQESSTEKETDKRPPYLLRPFLLRGEASMLYASKSTGKSALALSMAAAVVSGKELFDEKWWVVPKIKEDPFYKVIYPYRKVLYLDFENGEREIRERKKTFVHCYWPAHKDEWRKCNDNLIVEDMTKREVKDYSAEENWGDITDLLNTAREKGISGQPVDLLVIDTVSKFIQNSYIPNTNLANFINEIRKKNIAVLLIHHEGSKKNIRGRQNILDDMYFTVRLSRAQNEDEEQIPDKEAYNSNRLEIPSKLEFITSRSGIEDEPPFDIYFNKTVWKKYHADKSLNLTTYKDEEFKRIVKNYLDKRLENQDIYPILGIGRQNYFNRKKKVGLTKGK